MLIFTHGRSRMAIGPRIPTMPERSTSGFRRRGRHCLHQPRSALGYAVSRMTGEPHPTKNRLLGDLPRMIGIIRVGSWISIYWQYSCTGSTPSTGFETASTASTWPTYVRPTLCLLNHMETHRIAPHQRGEAVRRRHAHTEGVGYKRWNNISVAATRPLQTRTAGLKIPKPPLPRANPVKQK